MKHHTGATIFGASSHGELRTMADAVTATPPPTTKEGPYQDRPLLCPFRLAPLPTCSGSTIAFPKILKIQGPNPKI